MKKMIIAVVSIVLVIGVAVGIWMATSNDDNRDSTEKNSLSGDLFNVSHYDDFKEITEQRKIETEQIEESYFAYDVEAFGEELTFSFVFDNEKNLLESAAYCEFEANFTKTEKFKKKVDSLLNGFVGMFSVESSDFYVFSATEVLDCTDTTSLQKVMNGEASIELRVRDEQSEYWVMKIDKNSESEFFCVIEHYVNYPEYDEIPVNIDLSNI